MKKITLMITAILLSLNLIAQWQQTNGPVGGWVNCFASDSSKIIAGSQSGGVFLSTNYGSSWTSINNGLPGMTYVKSIAMKDSMVFLSVGDNIYKSINNGNFWSLLNTGISFPTFGYIAITDTVLFATISTDLYKSLDYGVSWVPVTTYPGAMNTSIVANGSDLFATDINGLYITTNNSATWTLTSVTSTSSYPPVIEGNNILLFTPSNLKLSTNYGLTWSTIAPPSAMNPAIAIDNGILYAGTAFGLYYSSDLGTTWIPTTEVIPNVILGNNIKCIIGINNDILVGEATGGVYKSSDLGMTWIDCNEGLTATKVNAITIDGTNIYIASEKGGIAVTSDNGQNWTKLDSGITNYNMKSIGVNGANLFSGSSDYFFVSNDSGNYWNEITVSPYAISSIAINGLEIFVTSSIMGDIMYSPDNGITWMGIYSSALINSMNAILFNSTNILSAGNLNSTNGAIFLSINNGSTWTPVFSGTPVYSLAANGSYIYGGTDYGIVFSNNGGVTWSTPTNAGIPSANRVNSLVTYGSYVFAGTDAGFYTSADNGNLWNIANTGLAPPYSVYSLASNGTDIFAGVNYSSVWKRTLSEIATNCISHYTVSYDSIFNAFDIYVDSISSSIAVAYHWDFADGTTSTLAAPVHIYTFDTLYNVCMKIYTSTGDSCEYCHIIGRDDMGNVIRSTGGFTINIHNLNAGISENHPLENEITISPSPFTTLTTITFAEEQKNTIIKVYDVVGECVLTQTIRHSNNITIDLSDVSKGIYFVQITDENKNVVNKKIIVQ